ncbi:MAG: fimbria/pilus periplasmic chaperone [Sphingomonas fennica]
MIVSRAGASTRALFAALSLAMPVAAVLAQDVAIPAGGAGLAVAPVMLTLAGDARTVSTIVSNPGAASQTVQARLYAWTSRGEDEVYAPTDEIGFSPPLFKLAAGGTQAIRLVSKVAPGPVERSYRLIVDQLPLPDAPGQLQMPVRMVLPVFVAPAPGVVRVDRLEWNARFDAAAGIMRIRVENRGTIHAKITDLAVEDGGGSTPVAPGLAGYALAGQAREWSYRTAAAPQSLTIVAHSGPASIRAKVIVAR